MSPRLSFPLLLSLFCTVASLLLLAWLLGGFSPTAHAGTWTVCPAGPPACDYATVQEAVDAAGAGDVVKVAAGLYAGGRRSEVQCGGEEAVCGGSADSEQSGGEVRPKKTAPRGI